MRLIQLYKIILLLLLFSTLLLPAFIDPSSSIKEEKINLVIDTDKGKKVTRNLFKYLLDNSKKYISNELHKNETKERLIADFISGMTDRYAINLHNKIK